MCVRPGPRGLDEQTILFKHVLANCSVPIITRMTIAIPFLITGAFLLEIFFGIPGLGSELYRSIMGSDFPVVKAFTMLGAVLYVFFNILADVLYAVFDPRIRLSRGTHFYWSESATGGLAPV